MLGFLKRAIAVSGAGSLDTGAQAALRELGASLVAVKVPGAQLAALAPECQAVLVGSDGRARRIAGGKRVELRDGELAYAFHPGPYTVDVNPFAGAPELGLRTSFAVDAPDPQAAQQRFDLFLAAEVSGSLSMLDLAGRVEQALQRELEGGGLALPPCTTLEEWNAFRQGLNQLLYMRFGLTVDDCVPVDLGESRDFAQMLAARALAPAQEPHYLALPDESEATQQDTGAEQPAPPMPQARADAAARDERALRRLFLELPCLMCGLRLAALPANQALFHRQQALLQRLDLLSVGVNTMPALELAAPGQPLAPSIQLRRARHSARAAASLGEAWALLARLRQADEEQLAPLYDEAERIVANLEADCAARRAVREEGPA